MEPITRVVPVPRWLNLGGKPYRVSELRLIDLARIQGWLDGLAPDPLEAVRGLDPGLSPDDRRKALARAYKAADKGAPVLFEPSGAAALSTPEGRCMLVWVAVRRYRRGFGLSKAASVAHRMTDREFFKLHDVAFGTDPLALIGRLLWGDDPHSRGPSVGWGEVIEDLRKDTGQTLQYIYSLTLTEISNIRRGGKPILRGRKLRLGENAQEALASFRALFADLDDDSNSDSDPESESKEPI